MAMERKKILFMAEAVTLAHVARPLALAQALDRRRYDVSIACASGYDMFFKGSALQPLRINSISSERFLAALAAGKPVYDAATLQQYVDDDLRIINQVLPDVIIGDFRLSLSVSARVAGVPYISLINAYWSPYVRQQYQVPALPWARLLPVGVADRVFRLARPLAFALHSMPLNQVRRAYRLPSLGLDLRRVYTDGDHVLYADIPQMFPARDMPASHSYMGAVIWSPPTPLPVWWDQLPAERPVVYVTLGSSGQGSLLPHILQALAPLPVTVIAATAGGASSAGLAASVPANAHVASYLPGAAAAQRAQLVICNGGSPTSQQALVAGVPVLGIAGNLDQYLNMHGVCECGAGRLLRSDRFTAPAVRTAVLALLEEAAPRAAAMRLAGHFASYNAGSQLSNLLGKLLPA